MFKILRPIPMNITIQESHDTSSVCICLHSPGVWYILGTGGKAYMLGMDSYGDSGPS